MPVFINQQVLRLQITIDNVLTMHVTKSQQYFANVKHCHVITKSAIFPQSIEQLTSRTILKEHINKSLILKGSFKRVYERMVELHQNFLFHFYVINLLEFNYVTFRKLFECKYLFVGCYNLFNSAEGASP